MVFPVSVSLAAADLCPRLICPVVYSKQSSYSMRRGHLSDAPLKHRVPEQCM